MSYNLYRCPLSKKIYYDPVVAEDGFIYERNEIYNWLTDKRMSPTTGKPMGPRLQRAKKIKLLVDEYLKEHPEEKTDRYYYKVLYNKDEVVNYVYREEFERLFDYEDYWLNDCVDVEGRLTLVEFICDKCKDDKMLKYVISNSVDYDTPNFDGMKPITTIIINCSINIVKFVIEKMDIILDEPDGRGIYPIHTMLAEKGTDVEFVKYLLDMGFDFELPDGANNRPIHYLARYGSTESMLAIADIVNWEVKNSRGLKPIHIVCKNWDCVKIDKILDLPINLADEVDDKSGTTCLDILYANKYLDKQNKHNMIYKYIDKMKKSPVIEKGYLETLDKF
jgi:hypothetical protein